MNTILLALALFTTFTQPINTGAQRAQAQEIAPIAIVIEEETKAAEQIEGVTSCNSAEDVPAAPQLSDYLDGDTPTETAHQDYLSDLAWWYAEFNVCPQG